MPALFMEDHSFFEEMVRLNIVTFDPGKTIQFASGIRSPGVKIHMHLLERHPHLFVSVVENATSYINRYLSETEVIAAIATGATSFTAVIAYKLGLPRFDIRKNGHGKIGVIEGGCEAFEGKRALVIDDIGTSYGSALAGASFLRGQDVKVDHALFLGSYGFGLLHAPLLEKEVMRHWLFKFEQLLQVAIRTSVVKDSYALLISQWLHNPWAPWEWPEELQRSEPK